MTNCPNIGTKISALTLLVNTVLMVLVKEIMHEKEIKAFSFEK